MARVRLASDLIKTCHSPFPQRHGKSGANWSVAEARGDWPVVVHGKGEAGKRPGVYLAALVDQPNLQSEQLIW